MRDFKGFDDWIEIFKGGKQVDSLGRVHDGDAIIAKAVTSFNTAVHEPPLVVGHPVDNAPAFGWVDQLAATVANGTKVLIAKFKQVVPEFEDMAKRGLYKKRSASFYPDGRLRHVGFLGAAPPAVKGLADIGFGDGEDISTFEEAGDIDPIKPIAPISKTATTNKEGTMVFKDKLKNMLSFMGVDMAKVPDDALPDAPPEGAGSAAFSEADLAAAKRQAAEEARRDERKKADAEFAEKERETAKTRRSEEITRWYDGKLQEGKVLPAWAKMGLKEFMLGLDGENEIQFSETSTATNLEWFKNFMAELPKVVNFEEIAKRGDDVGAGGAGERLSALVAKKRAENKDLEFTEAFKLVQIENPDLALEYQTEIRPNA